MKTTILLFGLASLSIIGSQIVSVFIPIYKVAEYSKVWSWFFKSWEIFLTLGFFSFAFFIRNLKNK